MFRTILGQLGHAKMLVLAGVMGTGLTLASGTARAQTGWTLGFSVGPVAAAPRVVIPAPQMVYAQPIYAVPVAICVPPVVTYTPAPVIVYPERERFDRDRFDHDRFDRERFAREHFEQARHEPAERGGNHWGR